MNNTELANKLHTRTGIPEYKCRNAVAEIISLMTKELCNGNTVDIAKFGTFKRTTVPARKRYTPSVSNIYVKAKLKVRFSASSKFFNQPPAFDKN